MSEEKGLSRMSDKQPATLASLLKKLSKDDRNIVVAQLVGALEETQSV